MTRMPPSVSARVIEVVRHRCAAKLQAPLQDGGAPSLPHNGILSPIRAEPQRHERRERKSPQSTDSEEVAAINRPLSPLQTPEPPQGPRLSYSALTTTPQIVQRSLLSDLAAMPDLAVSSTANLTPDTSTTPSAKPPLASYWLRQAKAAELGATAVQRAPAVDGSIIAARLEALKRKKTAVKLASPAPHHAASTTANGEVKPSDVADTGKQDNSEKRDNLHQSIAARLSKLKQKRQEEENNAQEREAAAAREREEEERRREEELEARKREVEAAREREEEERRREEELEARKREIGRASCRERV